MVSEGTAAESGNGGNGPQVPTISTADTIPAQDAGAAFLLTGSAERTRYRRTVAAGRRPGRYLLPLDMASRCKPHGGRAESWTRSTPPKAPESGRDTQKQGRADRRTGATCYPVQSCPIPIPRAYIAPISRRKSPVVSEHYHAPQKPHKSQIHAQNAPQIQIHI